MKAASIMTERAAKIALARHLDARDSASARLEEQVAALLRLHELYAPARADARLGSRSRPCRCGRPIAIADDAWFPGSRRDLKCGRDIRDGLQEGEVR
jgi:hypothetical protein